MLGGRPLPPALPSPRLAVQRLSLGVKAGGHSLLCLPSGSPFNELSSWQVILFCKTFGLIWVICKLASPSMWISIEIIVYIKINANPIRLTHLEQNMFTS